MPALLGLLAQAAGSGQQVVAELPDGASLVAVGGPDGALGAVVDDGSPLLVTAVGDLLEAAAALGPVGVVEQAVWLPDPDDGQVAELPAGAQGTLSMSQFEAAASPVLSFAAAAEVPVTVAVFELAAPGTASSAQLELALVECAARLVRSMCRNDDLVAHVNGSTFAVLFSGSPVPEAAVRARCAAQVDGVSVQVGPRRVPVAARVGVVTAPVSDSVSVLVVRAAESMTPAGGVSC